MERAKTFLCGANLKAAVDSRYRIMLESTRLGQPPLNQPASGITMGGYNSQKKALGFGQSTPAFEVDFWHRYCPQPIRYSYNSGDSWILHCWLVANFVAFARPPHRGDLGGGGVASPTRRFKAQICALNEFQARRDVERGMRENASADAETG